MKLGFDGLEELLPGYFSGELSEKDRVAVEVWRDSSPESKKMFHNSKMAWESMSLLSGMEQFNPFEALKKVNRRIEPKPKLWLRHLQRVAAILLLPILVFAGVITQRQLFLSKGEKQQDLWETVTCRHGMVSQFSLPDNTTVWLNSGSQLKFPHKFTGENRNVEITGEAYFKVTPDAKKPFIVSARNLDIKVVGTEFNVINYPDEESIEVVLVTGKINLFTQLNGAEKRLGSMNPGLLATFGNESKKIEAKKVDVNKYTLWRDGILAFNNEPMSDVIKRLNRWFNAEIIITDKEIEQYVYRATFSSESLEQVLYLLKISAPIDYRLENRSVLSNGKYSKQKVYLMKRK